MLTRSARARGFGGRVGDAILGSWTRTVAVVAVALVIFGIIGFLADLVTDGQIELQATRTGDGSHLTEADAGNNLARLKSVLARNAAGGVTEDFTNQLSKVTVGKLVDPNDRTVTWCVEEIGTSRITYSRTSDGSVVSQQLIKFDDRFWLVDQGGHYLITDVQVATQVVAG